jgi:hypothetical protein
VLADVPTWIGAIAAAASAAFVLMGGFWAYFKFVKDSPYIARTNFTVDASLLTADGKDVVRAKCTASAVGRGRIVFIKDDGYERPAVFVYALTPELIRHPPDAWNDPSGETEIFAADESVEAGECLRDDALAWVGDRQSDTVAYRVIGSLTAADKKGAKPYTWWSVCVVPVTLRRSAAEAHDENDALAQGAWIAP